MADTSYLAPADLGEAVQLLAEHAPRVTILAGGTDLLPKINYYELKPDILMYIGGLNLDYIKADNGRLVMGAATPVAKVAGSSLLADKAVALIRAANQLGSPAVRTSGTVGGNIANGSPAADSVTPLLVLDADLRLRSNQGERVVPLNEFFTGPEETVRRPDELIVEISMPVPQGKTSFQKLGRRQALTCSVVNVAARLEMDGERCRQARLALGAVAPTPIRCPEAEALLEGKTLTPDIIAQAAEAAVAASRPIDDVRASAWYRRQVTPVLVKRALSQAAGIETTG